MFYGALHSGVFLVSSILPPRVNGKANIEWVDEVDKRILPLRF